MIPRWPMVVAAFVATAACGSTVPVAQQFTSLPASTARPDGLSAASTGLPGTSTAGGSAARSGGAVDLTTRGLSPGNVPPAAAAPSGRPALPGRRVTKPVTIGFLNTGSNAALAASFGKKGTSVTWQGTDDALIAYYNGHGGIAGRKIIPVYYTVQTTSSSFTADTQAACAKFTQDNHVDLVMTTAGTGSFDNYESCLSKAHMVNIEAYDQGSTDLGTFNRYPGLFTAGAPIVDHAITATLAGLVKSGYISKKNKIGIVVEDCPYNVRAFQDSYLPLANKLELSVLRRDASCVDNAAGLGGFLNQVGSAVLPFRSAGIDRVSFVSDFESVALLGFSDQAQSQAWMPGYALTSAAHAGSNAAQLSQPQLPQMVGVGGLPNVDVTSRDPVPGPARTCRQILTSQGVTGSSAADYSILDTDCDVFRLLGAALAKSNGDSSTPALMSSLRSLGAADQSAAVVAGRTDYGPRSPDGAPLSAVFGYEGACACFRYSTQPTLLP